MIIYIIKKSRSCDIHSLQRDSLLLQFLFGFTATTPLIIVNLYQLLPDIIRGHLHITWPEFPIIVSCLAANIFSLLLTIISYIGNDRLHSEERHVVYPGHMTALIWHVCLIIGRIMALALFAIAFGPFIAIIIGIHWLSAIIWTFFEKTNFCGDITTTPPKKRYHLEIPFVFVISFVYIFLFFNIRDGSTMSRIVVYHVLTSVETLVLAALFYAILPNFPLSPWLFGFTVGFYIVGIAFMSLYYAAWHPNRTRDCFKIGIPHSFDCCHIFHKLSITSMTGGNVDLPLEGTVQLGGHRYGIRGQGVPQAAEHGVAGVEDAGVTLIDYNPLDNLSLLMSRRSSFTIGQLSRSLNNTPQTTPQHNRGASRHITTDKTVSNRHNIENHRGTKRGSTPIQLTSDRSHSNTDNTMSLSERPASVNMETRRVPFGSMGGRSLSEDTRMIPSNAEINNNGIGQITTMKPRPASETIDVRSYTPTHHRYPRNSQWFHRTRSERYPAHRSSNLSYKSETDVTHSGSHSTPLSRRSDDMTSINRTSDVIRLGPNRYSITNHHSGMIVLPSPIGEEPVGSTRFGYQGTSPIILKINGTPTPNSIPHSTTTGPKSYRWSDVHYSDFIPASKNHSSMYIDTPVRTRQRSVSPVDSRHGLSRSTNSTPRTSPYPGRRHRNPSNPLHSHDPMKEFTQLYSSNPPRSCSGVKDRLSESTTPRITSSSSSYLVSSDNHSDVADYITTTDEAIDGATSVNKHKATTNGVQNHLINNKRHIQVKVTAHRQNSDEFLITKLHNINGTLV